MKKKLEEKTQHDETCASKISYREDGSVEREEWNLNDKLHRVDGPAYTRYRKDGSVKEEEWWFDGKEMKEW